MNSVVDKMDPPLINESSFSAANPASYSLAEIWPFSGEPGGSGGGLGLRMGNLGQSLGGPGDCSVNRDGSLEESTVTEQSGGGGGGGGGGRKRRDVSSEDESSKQVSTSSGNGLVPHPSRASLGPTGTSPSRFAPIGQQGHPLHPLQRPAALLLSKTLDCQVHGIRFGLCSPFVTRGSSLNTSVL
ncbi:transcription factor bHLH79-like isoform X1 [Pyrus x bretschneideri]|uniref:transcription factor bHLH79-like isoform X1 n=1 Tax=Pyrus x bretschneideri TaxID=225117 RepID=UPI00202F46FF|nr:transcription factor bHLH79-like isoform X1 [Pyrus x bretschneideri]